jgi:hypothetical protein
MGLVTAGGAEHRDERERERENGFVQFHIFSLSKYSLG